MPSKIKIEIRAELRDVSGRLIKRFPWKSANSLLKQFIQVLAVQMSQIAQSIRTTINTLISLGAETSSFQVNAGIDITTWGILIGTGTTAVTMTDYKLVTQVSANVAHGAVSLAVENPDAATWRLAISRAFTNNTGASLGIREVAIYFDPGAWAEMICLDRTLYSVDVPNGVAVTFTYRITVTL